MLDKLLQYHQQPDSDDFVVAVMRRIKRQQQIRSLILVLSGIIGAGFGLIGAMLLADAIAPWMTQLLAGDTALIKGCVLLLLLGFFAWLLHEDGSLSA